MIDYNAVLRDLHEQLARAVDEQRDAYVAQQQAEARYNLARQVVARLEALVRFTREHLGLDPSAEIPF